MYLECYTTIVPCFIYFLSSFLCNDLLLLISYIQVLIKIHIYIYIYVNKIHPTLNKWYRGEHFHSLLIFSYSVS